MKIKALIDICWRSEIDCRVIDECKAGESVDISDELGQQFIDAKKAELHTDKPIKEVKVVEPVKEIKATPKKKTKRVYKKKG